jgi:hypothetical protein
MLELDVFDKGLLGESKTIWKSLRISIETILQHYSAKLYHGSPVWFINDNPIVGYSQKKEGVALLFWSGQSFETPGLKKVGKHKASELVLKRIEDLDKEKIERWLQESMEKQWNYRDIVKNKGKLDPLVGVSG